MARKIRVQRLAERIREELSEILRYEVTDPRLSGVTVTQVTVDREFAYAKIYVSALEGSERKSEIITGFESAAGFLRRQLSQRIELRSFPQLRFKWDPIPERAARIDDLIASLHEEKTDQDDDLSKNG
jgi:ribosome-binding factor A